MTAVTEPVTERQLFTESVKHAFCTLCNPPPCEQATALCGWESDLPIYVPVFCDTGTYPPNACVVCVELFLQPCVTCGSPGT